MSDREPQPVPSPTDRNSGPLTGLLLGGMAMFGALAINIYLPAIPVIAHDLHARMAAAQMTVSAFVAGVAVGQLMWGSWSELRGRRIPLAAGAALFITASLVCAIAPSVEILIGARFVQGFGACAGMVLARAIVADWFTGKEAASSISWQHLVAGLAPIFAPLIGALLLNHTGWRSIFCLLALLSAAVATTLLRTIGESHSDAARAAARLESRFAAYRALVSNPRINLKLATAVLAAAPLMMWYGAASPLFQTGFGWSPGQASWLFGMLGVVIVSATQINRLLLRRFSREAIIRTTLLLTAVTAFAAALCVAAGLDGAPIVAPALIVSVSGYGLVSANLQAGILDEDRSRAGSLSALIGSAIYGGGGIASAAAGVIPPASGASLLALIAMSLAGARLALALAERHAPITQRARASG